MPHKFDSLELYDMIYTIVIWFGEKFTFYFWL